RSFPFPYHAHRVSGLRPLRRRRASRPHDDQPSERDNHPTVPHPPYERVDGEPEHGLLGAVHHATEHDVEILAQIAPDADLGGWLERRPAKGIDVFAFRRGEHGEPLPLAPRLA